MQILNYQKIILTQKSSSKRTECSRVMIPNDFNSDIKWTYCVVTLKRRL